VIAAQGSLTWVSIHYNYPMIKLLHFADAHIDIANYGVHDPRTGLPLRVMDFLKSLDTIVDTAIEEQVDLVTFAGDAYKDRSPAPPFNASGAGVSCASRGPKSPPYCSPAITTSPLLSSVPMLSKNSTHSRKATMCAKSY